MIAANEGDYFLWSRLGNVYDLGERPDLAEPVLAKAIELCPQDIESHHSLGEIRGDAGDAEGAARHYRAVLRHARDCPARTRAKPDLVRALVRDALERIMELHFQSGGKIELYDAYPSSAAGPSGRHAAVTEIPFNAADPNDFERLIDRFLGPGQPRALPASGQGRVS